MPNNEKSNHILAPLPDYELSYLEEVLWEAKIDMAAAIIGTTGEERYIRATILRENEVLRMEIHELLTSGY
jgi:hypothetical protein